MKRFTVILIMILLFSCFSGCVNEHIAAGFFTHSNIDGLNIWVNPVEQFAFAGTFFCDEYYDGIQITIPDEYNGIPITQLGGKNSIDKADSFSIHISNHFLNVPEDSPYYGVTYTDPDNAKITDTYVVEDLVFVLNIGKNINKIELAVFDYYYPSFDETGSLVFYHPVVYVVCSEQNDTFFSKDGVLYDKSTESQVLEFDYAN